MLLSARHLRLPLLAGIMACNGDTTEPRDSTPEPTPPSPPADLREALEQQGFEVREGGITFDAAQDCCSWNTCLHVNPNGEYGTWAVPPHPDEFIEDRAPDDEGRVIATRMRHDEALLYAGPPPPGAEYVSFRGYINDSAGPDGRTLAFTSLGDSLNAGVWTQGADGELLVLTTSNATTAERVAAAAAAVGWPEPNIDVVPSGVAALGLGEEADTIRITLRVVGLTGVEAFDTFRNAPTASVWRLTPTEEFAEAPIAMPDYRQPVAADDAGLDDAVEQLRLALLAGHPDFDVQESVLEIMEPPLDAPCWSGCNRDVSYTKARAIPLHQGEKIVAYGVDPMRIGRARWTGIVLHGLSNSDSGGGAGSDMLEGSAIPWLPDHPDADKLFAWTFARDCGADPFCTTVPYGCPGIDEDELARVVWRHYEDPVTHAFPPNPGLGSRGALRFLPMEPTR